MTGLDTGVLRSSGLATTLVTLALALLAAPFGGPAVTGVALGGAIAAVFFAADVVLALVLRPLLPFLALLVALTAYATKAVLLGAFLFRFGETSPFSGRGLALGLTAGTVAWLATWVRIDRARAAVAAAASVPADEPGRAGPGAG